jgi:glycosyltransferase involved in cell wall biosynthesis
LNQISAVIICCNEEAKIERALRSLNGIADEIVVVDSGSRDRTLDICRRYTSRIFEQDWQGYRAQKQYATEKANHDWVLSVDADEELSTALRTELRDWKASSAQYEGYSMPRKACFMGRWIEHTTWYPDRQVRLFRKASGGWEGGRVHESFRVVGPVGQLNGELYHYTYSNLGEYLNQLGRFSALAAADLNDRGKSAPLLHALVDPPFVFLKNYILKRGFLDGTPGLIISLISSVSILFKYLMLWEIRRFRQEDQK